MHIHIYVIYIYDIYIYKSKTQRQAARFHWRRGDGAELLLRDAFDDVNTDPAAWLWRSGPEPLKILMILMVI